MNLPVCGRVLFSATLVRGHIAKFHIPYLKWFKEQGWETWVAAKNDYPDGVCEIPYCDHFVDIDFARNPFSKQTLTAYRQLRGLFACERFDIVHTHTPVGSVLTRLAARDARKGGTRVIYTAHGFHFYKGAPLANWLLWYPVERAMSRCTDVLITINHEDCERAKRFAHCRVEYVPGVGVDLSRFAAVKCRDAKRAELGLAAGDFALLSIGDLNANKNHRMLVEAVAQLPGNVKLFIAGDGPLRRELETLAARLGVADRVRLLGFRCDIAALLTACDLFCLPSKREGLPVSLIESIAAGTPALASNARGCADVLGELGDSWIVPMDDSRSWSYAISRCMGGSHVPSSECLRARAERFGISSVLADYASIYNTVVIGSDARFLHHSIRLPKEGEV